MIKNIRWINRNVLVVERADGQVLLIRRHFPCSHRTINGDEAHHLHYYITSKDKDLNKLIDWLDRGFWWDSMLWDTEEGVRELITRFAKYRCPGALQAI